MRRTRGDTRSRISFLCVIYSTPDDFTQHIRDALFALLHMENYMNV